MDSIPDGSMVTVSRCCDCNLEAVFFLRFIECKDEQ